MLLFDISKVQIYNETRQLPTVLPNKIHLNYTALSNIT